MKNENGNPAEKGISEKSKYDYLRKLDSAKLQALLQQESFLSDDDSFDDGIIRYIVVILEEREPIFDDQDVNASLEKFKAEVIPKLEKGITIGALWNKKHYSGKSVVPARGYKKHRIAIALVAAILTIIVSSTAIASAVGFDLWEHIISWGKETFRIGTGMEVAEESELTESVEGEATTHMVEAGSYRTISEAVEAMDILILTLNWLPDDFSLTKIETSETPMHKAITALYQNGGKVLMYNATVYSSNKASSAYEMDEGSGEVLVINDLKHYFMGNIEQVRVVWTSGECVYSINGNITKDEIVQMLNSIYEGER